MGAGRNSSIPTPPDDRPQPPAPAEPADQSDRDDLIATHIGLARSLARRFANRGERTEDLEQVALLALVGAAERFDTSRGLQFSTFATATILGSLKRHFRDNRWGMHVNRSAQERYLAVRDATDELTGRLSRAPTPLEVGEAVGLEPEEVVAARETEMAAQVGSLDANAALERPVQFGADDNGYLTFEARSDVMRALSMLSEADREVVRLRFVERLTQAEIGARLGISQMQVSRILTRSLSRVRSHLSGG